MVFDFGAVDLDAVDLSAVSARVVFGAVDLDRTPGFVLDDAGVLTAARVFDAAAFARAAVALVAALVVTLDVTLARALFADVVLEPDVVLATDAATAFRAVAAFAGALAADAVRLAVADRAWPVSPFTGLRAAWTAACPGRFAGAFVRDAAEETPLDFFFDTAVVFAMERALAAFEVLTFDAVALDAAAFDFNDMGRRTP